MAAAGSGRSEWVPHLPFLNRYPLYFGELVHCELSTLAAESRVFDATERNNGFVPNGGAVDVDHTGLEGFRELHGSLQVVSHYSRGQSILTVIRERKSMIMVLRTNDAGDGTKTLGPEYAHRRQNIGQNRRFVEAFTESAAAEQSRTLPDRCVHLALDEFRLLRPDQGPDNRIRLLRWTDFETIDFLRKRFTEFVANRRFDDHSRARHADLALMGEIRESRRGNRVVDVGIVKYDQRILASEFKRKLLEIRRAFGRNDLSNT